MRSYDEYCAAARALDVVGDRWTLLIVRELALQGPCRYTDLRNGLPGIATNLLAQRLRELERAGVVAREEAPPPIATTLFRLTARGEELRPVLAELVRWGMPLMTEPRPADAVRSRWLAWALEFMLTDRDPARPPTVIELRTGDEQIAVEAGGGAVHVRLARAEHPDVTLSGPPMPIMGVVLGLLDVAAAGSHGVTIDGDPRALARVGGPGAPAAPADVI